MDVSRGYAARLWRLAAAAVGAGLVMSALIVAPAYAARPGGGGGGGKPTPPPKVMTLTYDPTPVLCVDGDYGHGGTLLGRGSGFTAGVFTLYKTTNTGFNVYTSSNDSGPTGEVAFSHCLKQVAHGGAVPYLVEVQQRQRNKTSTVYKEWVTATLAQ
jgi:hypothetical protein